MNENMKKFAILTGVMAVVIGGVTLAPSAIEAYRGDPGVLGPNHAEERHEVMTMAFENQDYQSWKEQMQGRGRVTEVITEENFARFAEAHRLVLEGKTDEANQIRAELGLGQGQRNSDGQGRGYGKNR